MTSHSLMVDTIPSATSRSADNVIRVLDVTDGTRSSIVGNSAALKLRGPPPLRPSILLSPFLSIEIVIALTAASALDRDPVQETTPRQITAAPIPATTRTWAERVTSAAGDEVGRRATTSIEGSLSQSSTPSLAHRLRRQTAKKTPPGRPEALRKHHAIPG